MKAKKKAKKTSTRSRGKDRKKRKVNPKTTASRKPAAVKRKDVSRRAKRVASPWPQEAILRFQQLRAHGGAESSFRAIRETLGAEFGKKPALKTLERWTAKFDDEIRSIQRELEVERKAWVLKEERARLEYLTGLAQKGMNISDNVMAEVIPAIRRGDMDPSKFLAWLVSISTEARLEQKGKDGDGMGAGGPEGGSGTANAEFLMALVREAHNDPENAKGLLQAALGVGESLAANHPDIAERLGRTHPGRDGEAPG